MGNNSTTKMRRLSIALLLSAVAIAKAHAGSVVGYIKFVDAPPKLAAVKVTKDQDYCGESLPNETYLIGSNGGLRNVVVFVEQALSSEAGLPKEVILDNDGCRFSPRVLALTKGDRLKVRNSDLKLHIAHSYLGERTVFTVSLPFRGTTIDVTKKIRNSGLLTLHCDTHAWMRGYIYVFDHPFFAVTDEQGSFSIPNLPAGKYTLKAWHEDAGVRSQEVTISERGETRVNFEFAKK